MSCLLKYVHFSESNETKFIYCHLPQVNQRMFCFRVQAEHLLGCVCLWTISFEQYDFGPRYLECWFSLILSHVAPGSPAPLINLVILALYVSIICLFTLYPHLPFFLLVFSFENRPSPFQARGHKMQPNLGYFSCFSLFYVIVFLMFLMHDYLCSVSLGLLYIFVVISSVLLYTRFLSTSQEIGRKEHLRNDLFCV